MQEPALARTTNQTTGNAYEGRWRWWYSAIADWMIRNPGQPMTLCAKELNKHVNTISQIANTDLFKEYLAQRKAQWRDDHDHSVRSRLTSVAEQSLDLILDTMRAKGNQIPLQRLESLASSALDRLGYAPASSPSVVVNTHNGNNQTVVVPGLTPQALEEARAALRSVEAQRAGSSFPTSLSRSQRTSEEPGAETIEGEFSSVDDLLEGISHDTSSCKE